MRRPKLKAVPRPVDHGDSLVSLFAPKLRPENRVFVQEQGSPVIARERSCGTSSAIAPCIALPPESIQSCVALPETYAKL